MFQLEKTFRFEAAHKLPNHCGKCCRLHGHSWQGTVVITGGELQGDGAETGMLTDFSNIKAALETIITNYLDHHYLNETTGLKDPTSERIAQWLFEMLKPRLPLLTAVRIEETCTCRCEYRPGSRKTRTGRTPLSKVTH